MEIFYAGQGIAFRSRLHTGVDRDQSHQRVSESASGRLGGWVSLVDLDSVP